MWHRHLETVNHFMHLQLVWYKLRQKTNHGKSTLDLIRSTGKVIRPKTGQQLSRGRRQSNKWSPGDDEQLRLLSSQLLGEPQPHSDPGRSLVLSHPVSSHNINIYVTPPSPRGPGFTPLVRSTYCRSPFSSRLVHWSICSSNQSDSSCMSFHNFLLSIFMLNILINSLFIVSHSPFIYFRLSELGVM